MKPSLLAPPLRSRLDPRTTEFQENREAMLGKLAELEDLLDQAELGGGVHHHERLAKRGKLPVRERIAPPNRSLFHTDDFGIFCFLITVV